MLKGSLNENWWMNEGALLVEQDCATTEQKLGKQRERIIKWKIWQKIIQNELKTLNRNLKDRLRMSNNR